MKGVALTDHGNMFGVFDFVNEATKRGIKPLVGCEFYMVTDRFKKAFVKGEKDKRYHQLLLAKDQRGYQNLSKLCSMGFIDGLYGKFPRIDKELLLKYHEGLIATSCCIGAEVPQEIIFGTEERAEEKLKWWIDVFGDDYYIEIQRHRGLENIDKTGRSQEYVNQVLLRLAAKYNLKVVATNDSHYVDEQDWEPHDILLCVNTGAKISDPVSTDENTSGRFSFASSDFYFKTPDEMGRLFADVPQAIDNTMEVFDKITPPKLKRDILMPNFVLPTGFSTQDAYLRFLAYEGAKKHYGILTEEITERIELELRVMQKMGFAGYFLIVQDFTTAARQMGVSVGPGRGSAAGSCVAYCLGITNIDPIRYKLLFERFLNPERVSMPDIDIDFDDEGRQKVIDWVIDKYGRNQVAQIVTYGSMASKMSIKDVGRVLDVPLAEVNRITKLVPNLKLAEIFKKPKDYLQDKLSTEELAHVDELKALAQRDDDIGKMLRFAQKLEGSVRNTGIHAAGVIIAPDDITNYVPVKTEKDAELLITQVEGTHVEDAGLLKMDFLGLRTLTIIRDAIKNIEKTKGISIDPDLVPLDDEKTYELFQRGETVGIFQYESAGMQKYLRELKPTNIEDLVAMNALYRPGPMDYIPQFVARKHGREPVEYPHPWLEQILADTYGIMVYQEQIMQCAQIMADYSLGRADILRRAMGKKKEKEMIEQRAFFTEGAVAKGVPQSQADDIFDIMMKFASYGFNRSHAAAYAVLAYQTMYLKAHYPAEFMASVLTHNKSSVDDLQFFLQECGRMGLKVLGPDINESESDFFATRNGQIRFGLSGIKGVGEGPVASILKEREKAGHYQSIFDFTKRLAGTANKKILESLVYAGGFDSFPNVHRAQYFAPSDKYPTFLEHVTKYGQTVQQQSEANTLFGDAMLNSTIPEPKFPTAPEWSLVDKLEREKEVVGIYISGHPLDNFKMELRNFTTCDLKSLKELTPSPRENIAIAGMVIDVQHRTTKEGTAWGLFTIQDYSDTLELRLFKEDYLKFREYFAPGTTLHLKGKWQFRFNGNDKEYKITDISLLQTVAERLTQSISIHINLRDLSSALVQNLLQLCNEHNGAHTLKIKVTDPDTRHDIQFASKSQKVRVSSQLTNQLDTLGIPYKIN